MRGIAGIAMALVGFVGVVGGAGVQPGAPAKVVLDKARMEKIEQLREVTGELQAIRRTSLAAQEEGWVIEYNVREGDMVQVGAVLARLDDKLAQLEVKRVEAVQRKWTAQIAEQQADLDKRKRDLQKRIEAKEKGSATETEISDAETLVATATAKLDQAKAELATGDAELGLAKKRLEDMVIKAPLKGRVASKRTEIGQWLKRGDAVAELVQLDPIEAWLDVPEGSVARLQKALSSEGSAGAEAIEVQVRLRGLGETRSGKLAAIVPAADARSRLVPVRVNLANKDEMLRPGMSISGLVPEGRMEATLTIHKDALLRNDAGTYVYFNAGGTAQIARVEVLFATRDRLAVRSETLKADMEVVTAGNERMFPGQALAPMGAPPRPPTPEGGAPASGGAVSKPE